MLIRPATARDAAAIARVHVRGWRIGYADFIPAEFRARFDVETSTTRWLQSLAAPARAETIVAEADEQVLGFAGFGANRNDLGPDVGELHGLYVDPDCWDRGIGSALLVEAERWLCGAGFVRAILWTLEANQRTRRFYEGRGWASDGATDDHPSGAKVVRYAKQLVHDHVEYSAC